MSDEIKNILEDDREIAAIYDDREYFCHRVECDDVTKIAAYAEVGQAAYVPWFAVYQGSEIIYRAPASMVIVEYKV